MLIIAIITHSTAEIQKTSKATTCMNSVSSFSEAVFFVSAALPKPRISRPGIVEYVAFISKIH